MTDLLLLPALASDAALFDAQIRDLADVATIRIGDMLQDETLPDMARRVLASAPDRFAICGLSMGGYLAFEILRQAPERVERLALLDTSARADTAESRAARQEAIAATAKMPFEKFVRSGLARLLGPNAGDAVRQTVVDMALRVGKRTYIDQQTAIMGRPDSRPMLAGIAIPTLVMVGALDVITPPELAREMAAGIPAAKLVEVPGSGHLSALERPAEVTAALRDWLLG